MLPREKPSKLYVKVPTWWRKYEPCRGSFVLTSPLFAHVSSLFINDSPLTEALYRLARADHHVMVIMVFPQLVLQTDDFIKINFVDHDP